MPSPRIPPSTRREFARMLALAGGTLLSGSIVHAATPASHALTDQPVTDHPVTDHPASDEPATGRELLSRMKWFNEPASATIAEARLVVRARPKTDFWRKTYFGYVTDNGHFFHLPVSGDFVFEARLDGKYTAQYDQAGLMVRIDAQNWVKCGTEFSDNARHASVVFTREFSDGSTMNDLVASGPVWWRVVRRHDSLETLCSPDGKNFTSVRFGYLVPAPTAEVGIMCAAPEGGGFECVFDNLKLTAGAK